MSQSEAIPLPSTPDQFFADELMRPIGIDGERLNLIEELNYILQNPDVYSLGHGVVESEEEKHAAIQLVADVFYRHGYIPPESINEHGVIKPEYDSAQAHSDYFTTTHPDSGIVLSAVRQIYSPNNDFEEIHFFQGDSVEQYRRYVEKIISPKEVVEISQLVKRPGAPKISVLHLYRDMMRYSLEQGHKLWVMSVVPEEFAQLQFMFGNVAQSINGEEEVEVYGVKSKAHNVFIQVEEAYRIAEESKERTNGHFNPNEIIEMRERILEFFAEELFK